MRLFWLPLLFQLLGGGPASAQVLPTHSVTLTWADTQNPAGTVYNVYRATGLCSGNPSFSKIATALAAKTFSDTTVQVGAYCYYVTASLNNAESAPSVSAPATILPFPPDGLKIQVQ